MSDRIPVSKTTVEKINREMKRTGAGPIRLIKRTTQKPPLGLNAEIIAGWKRGRTKTAEPDHIKWVLNALADLPTRIMVTDEIHARLKLYRETSNIGPKKLLSNRDDVPEGLNYHIVSCILSQPPRTMVEAHLKYLEKIWNMPTQDHAVKITQAHIARLKELKDATGLTPDKLLKARTDIPENLSDKTIWNWMNGSAKTALQSHLDYTFAAYEEIQNTNIKAADFLPELRAHKARTRINIRLLLKDATDMPEGLTPRVVDIWFQGAIKTARKDHVEYVLKKWAAWETST